MSNENLKEEDEEIQLGSYKLENDYEYQKISPMKNFENEKIESDISTDSSGTSHKHIKSPHTLLKRESSGIPEGNSTVILLEHDQAEHLKRLLEEAEQSLSSRDVLIAMLQDQLKKIENLYKQSLDDTQELRHKYCITTQDLNNLRTICEKYKEDVEILSNNQANDSTTEEIRTLQSEVNKWKTQYTDLLKDVQLMEKKVATTVCNIPAQTPVDSLGNKDLEKIVNVLKEHCVSINNSLEEQNKKMDFVVRKLQEEMQQQQGDDDNNNNKNKIEEPTDAKANFEHAQIESRTNSINNHEELKNNISSSTLKDEMTNLKQQIEQLYNKNSQLQSEIREIDKLKEEINKLSTRLGNDDPFTFVGSQIEVKDSMFENLKKENEHLREELAILKNLDQPFFDSISETGSQNESTDGMIYEAQQIRNRQASRVSFALTSDRLDAELIELRHDNSELKHKIKELLKNKENSNNKDTLNVELLELRKLVKKQENDMDHLKHEANIIAERKNEIIKEFQNANEALKSDYKELVEINNQLKCNLQKTGIYNNIKSQHEKLTTTDVGTNTEEIYEKIESNSNNNNNKIQELDNGTNKQTTEILKEAVIESINTEMEKLKSTLCDRTECAMVMDKIKNELNNKTEQLAIIKSDLQIKATDILEKETIIKRKTSEIEQLKKIINDNKDILQELNNKRKEILESATKAQEMQTTINLLEIKLGKALEENENNNKELKNHKECKCKLRKLEAELSVLVALNEKLQKDNESLKTQINMMKNTLEQYREEAEFKKMENEKLRVQEDQLQKTINTVRRNSDNITREYNMEVEKNKQALNEITNECKEIEKVFQIKLDKVNEENEELKKSLQQKDEEAKELTDKINTLTNELDEIKSNHQKHLKSFERSMCEIKDLFKNKEDELMLVENELQEHEESLLALEEENARLKNLLQANIKEQENVDYSLTLKQTMELQKLEENYNNEKNKNAELNHFLDNIRKDVHNLKIQIQELLQVLENKLKLLKQDILSDESDAILSKDSINEMLGCIDKFNNEVLQLQRNGITSTTSFDEIERSSYLYEETNNEKLENSNNKSKSLHQCSPDLSNVSIIKELQIKREYLIQQLNSIEKKLNNPNLIAAGKNAVVPKSTSSSESVPTSQSNKGSEKDSYRTCPQICEADYEEKNTITDSEESQICDDTHTGYICSTITCPSWATSSEMIKLMETELYGKKIKSTTTQEDKSVETLNKNSEHFQKCPYIDTVSILCKVFPEQPTVCSTEKEERVTDLDNIDNQSQSQQSKLENWGETSQGEIYMDVIHSETVSVTFPAITEEKEEDAVDIMKQPEQKEELDEKIIDCSECPGCPSEHPIAIKPIIKDTSTPNNSLNEIKQYSKENNTTSKSSDSVQQPIKKYPLSTGIPVPVQNFHKKSKEKCPLAVATAKIKDSNIKEKQSIISDQNSNNSKSVNENPTILQQATAEEKASKESSSCSRQNPCASGTSQLSKTSNPHKSCTCSSSKNKDINHCPLRNNIKDDTNCSSKIIKNNCKCKGTFKK